MKFSFLKSTFTSCIEQCFPFLPFIKNTNEYDNINDEDGKEKFQDEYDELFGDSNKNRNSQKVKKNDSEINKKIISASSSYDDQDLAVLSIIKPENSAFQRINKRIRNE